MFKKISRARGSRSFATVTFPSGAGIVPIQSGQDRRFRYSSQLTQTIVLFLFFKLATSTKYYFQDLGRITSLISYCCGFLIKTILWVLTCFSVKPFLLFIFVLVFLYFFNCIFLLIFIFYSYMLVQISYPRQGSVLCESGFHQINIHYIYLVNVHTICFCVSEYNTCEQDGQHKNTRIWLFYDLF